MYILFIIIQTSLESSLPFWLDCSFSWIGSDVFLETEVLSYADMRLLSSNEWTRGGESLRLLGARPQTRSRGKHRLWEDDVGRHRPGSAVFRLWQQLQELPAAKRDVRWQEPHPRGGTQVVLVRRQDGGEHSEGDTEDSDAGSTRSTRHSPAGARQPVHRGASSIYLSICLSMYLYVFLFLIFLVFPDGGSGDCGAEGGVWRGDFKPHHGPADLCRLPDGIERGGIERLVKLFT